MVGGVVNADRTEVNARVLEYAEQLVQLANAIIEKDAELRHARGRVPLRGAERQ